MRDNQVEIEDKLKKIFEGKVLEDLVRIVEKGRRRSISGASVLL